MFVGPLKASSDGGHDEAPQHGEAAKVTYHASDWAADDRTVVVLGAGTGPIVPTVGAVVTVGAAGLGPQPHKESLGPRGNQSEAKDWVFCTQQNRPGAFRSGTYP